jgi:glutamate-1-semialdehyde 2,1-aminomutase
VSAPSVPRLRSSIGHFPDDAPASRTLYERALKVLPGGNSRVTLYYPPFPLYALSGQGCMLTDVDGVSRIDIVNNYSSYIHGHAHPELLRVIAEQLPVLMATGAPTEAEIELAEVLCKRVPSFERVRFANSGSEAVMLALKAARAFTGRPKIAKVEGAYHGIYDYAEVSLASRPEQWGDGTRPASVAPAAGTPSSVENDVIVLPFNDIDSTLALLERHRNDLAAVLIDPLPSRLCYAEATPAYISALREATRRHSQLLIFDEVYSFRLSSSGAQGLYRVKPDLTTLGKLIGGGFAVGAVAGRADVLEMFTPGPRGPRVPHGGTFNANPLTMTAGLAALKLLSAHAYRRLDEMGHRLRSDVDAAIRCHRWPARVMGRGSFVAFRTSERAVHDYRSYLLTPEEDQGRARLHIELLNRGVFAAPNGACNLSTAMADEHVSAVTTAVVESLAAIFE